MISKLIFIWRLIALCALGLSAISCSIYENGNSHADSGSQNHSVAVARANNSTNQIDAEADSFLKQLLQKMTLEEKVGQMVMAEIQHVTPADLTQYNLGAVLNGGGSFPNSNKHASVDDWVHLAQSLYEASVAMPDKRAAIPVIWGTDAVHGHSNVFGATYFPHNIGLGASDNPALVKAVSTTTAIEVAATGINWIFAPTVAVARDDRWGRTYESYSEDPRIVKSLAKSAVEGLQHGLTQGAIQTIATAKHFIGDGGTANGVDQGDTQACLEQLMDVHGLGFAGALEADVQTVMASFNSWNGTKIHGHPTAINTILKDKLGFNGFVVGDWNGHGQVDGCSNSSCAAAINAGIDMLMAPKDWKQLIENTILQVEQGLIDTSRINDAVYRILKVKYRAGLFDSSYQPKSLAQRAATKLGAQQHREIARQAVRESLVLLKNNQSVLPLKADSRVLIIGNGAEDISKQMGGWTLSWQGDGNSDIDFPGATSVAEGIKDQLENNGGFTQIDPRAQLTAEQVKALSFDAVIAIFGERPYAESAGDRKDLSFDQIDSNLLRQIQAYHQAEIPTVSIFLTGRALSINNIINKSNAFVVAWLPGSEGQGVADLIIGDKLGQPRYDFTGKLPFSWPQSSDQVSINNYPAYVEQPQFELGYGLSYTQPKWVGKLPEDDLQISISFEGDNSIPIFVKNIVHPWELYVGNQENWSVAVNGNKGATKDMKALSITPSDKQIQEDARKIKWASNDFAQIYFQYPQLIDVSQFAEKNGYLTFSIKLENRPDNPVVVRMDCKYPCSGSVDITKTLLELPKDEWQSIAIDLNCFRQTGADLTQIDTPFLLGTTGNLAVEIAQIAISPHQQTNTRIDCSSALSQLSP